MNKVSERALVQRLNRKLAKDGKFIKTNSAPGYLGLGKYYLIDWNRSQIVQTDCRVCELAAEYKVLKSEEEVA